MTEVWERGFGYTLDRGAVDIIIIIVLGLAMRAAAFVGLLVVARDRSGG